MDGWLATLLFIAAIGGGIWFLIWAEERHERKQRDKRRYAAMMQQEHELRHRKAPAVVMPSYKQNPQVRPMYGELGTKAPVPPKVVRVSPPRQREVRRVVRTTTTTTGSVGQPMQDDGMNGMLLGALVGSAFDSSPAPAPEPYSSGGGGDFGGGGASGSWDSGSSSSDSSSSCSSDSSSSDSSCSSGD